MRTVTFKSVLDEVVLLKGFQPDQLDLSSSQALLMAKIIERWTRIGWEYAFWPEWTLVEARTPASSVVSLDQAGQTKIGEIQGVYSTAKKAWQECNAVEYQLTASGIDLTHTTGAPATPYIKFRRRPPRFTTEAWNADNVANYEAGYIVYYPQTVSSQLAGECYQLESDGNGSYSWVKQDMPTILKDAVIHGAHSDIKRQDGKVDEAEYWESRFWNELYRAWDVSIKQQKRG